MVNNRRCAELVTKGTRPNLASQILLRHKDKSGRHDFNVADYVAHLSKWMMALHGNLPRHLAADGKFVDDVIARGDGRGTAAAA